MAWSKNPLIYPKVFHDLLAAAEEGRDKITWTLDPGRDARKYRFQFYAFKAAWEAKAERSRRLKNFQLAAQDELRAAKLGKYIPVVEGNKVTFISKDVVMMQEGIRMEVSDGATVEHETLDLVADEEGRREQQLSEKAENKSRKKLPSELFVPIAPGQARTPENQLAMKWFGVDTAAVAKEAAAPVPMTDEEKELMEQIRREKEADGNKHDEE